MSGRDYRRYPIMGYDPETPMRSAVMQALGMASKCWSEPPTGEFDSTMACHIGDELCDLLRIGGVHEKPCSTG